MGPFRRFAVSSASTFWFHHHLRPSVSISLDLPRICDNQGIFVQEAIYAILAAWPLAKLHQKKGKVQNYSN